MKAKRFNHLVILVRFTLLITTGAILLALAGAAEQPAYGYVDQGSGFLVMQLVGSGCAAALFRFRRQLASWFTRDQPRTSKVATSVGLPVRQHSSP